MDKLLTERKTKDAHQANIPDIRGCGSMLWMNQTPPSVLSGQVTLKHLSNDKKTNKKNNAPGMYPLF